MKKVGVLFLVFSFLLCISALPVLASDGSKEIEQLKNEVQKLMNKIQELEKKQKESDKKYESIKETATKLEQEDTKLKEEKKTRAISYWRDGWNIETPDKKFRLNMAGVLHFDTRVFESNSSASSFDIRRARYDMRGYLYRGDIEHIFRLQIEMADTPYLRNAYWMFKFMPELAVQLGQFKIPSGGADWLTEEAHVNFVEYATGTPVSPFFDRGINIHGKFLKDKIQANFAVMTGVGVDTDVTQGDWDSNKDWIARLLLIPFKDSDNKYLKGLHIAGSFQDGLQSIKTIRGEASNRTENYQSRWFRWVQNRVDLDERIRYGGELHWLVGPAILSYEFNRVEWKDLTVYNATTGEVARRFPDSYHADVHQVWVSYFLTGEEKTFEDVFFAWRQPKPKKNFSPKDGTWGAWEVLARYAYHDTSEKLFTGSNAILDGSNRSHSMTAGLRWIWNPKTRLMFDLNYCKSDEGKGIIYERNSKGVTGRDYKDSETALLMRLILTP